MTHAEIGVAIRELKNIFDIVRLVDVSMMTQYTVDEAGNIVQEPYQCYAIWNRGTRCENCISAKAFAQKCQMTKFEFIDNEIYFVISKYTEVDDIPYMLEMVIKITDQTLFGAYGRNGFINTINSYNQKLYVDPLTGAYNRQYYNEQLSGLPKINAVAMLDVDNFKTINDSYGHPTGDLILQKIVRQIQCRIADSGAVVRYGGDEFILTFHRISEEKLSEMLEEIRSSISSFRSEEFPQLKISISIGAVFCSEKATELLHEADKALYQAKKEKNRVVIQHFCPSK